jgi:hypothetical protein
MRLAWIGADGFRNFIQSGLTWIALKGFIRNKFVPARDPKLQQMEALNEKPLPGESVTTCTNRWLNGINHTWVEQLREAELKRAALSFSLERLSFTAPLHTI